MPTHAEQLRQSWPLPARPRPIVIIGAGGIAADAHLPAYRLAGFPVAGLFDIDDVRATALAGKWGLRKYSSLAEAVAEPGPVYDLAIPPAAHLDVLTQLPDGAAVLMQKPMGPDLAAATKILEMVRAKRLTAAVNFQLRFSPMMLAIADANARQLFGQPVDVEIHLNIHTPWHLFPFLKGQPRVEIAVHSIHYLDLIRSFLGEPRGVYARTLGHPSSDMAQTRTSAILDYGADIRCALSINHNHNFGQRFQDSTFRFEGDRGAAVAKLGVLLNYPVGEPDELWITARGDEWQQIPLTGTWFPHAFIGTMSNLQRFASGEDQILATAAEDAWHTMALAEACFASSAAPATQIELEPRAVMQ